MVSLFKTCFLSTLDLTYSNASNFQHSSVPGTYSLGVRRTPDQSDCDVIFPDRAIEKKSQKIIEK